MRTKNKRKDEKERVKAARRENSVLKRQEPKRLERPTILIVCEGINTEPSYFNQFRFSSATVKSIGEGYNTISLVNRAVEISRQGNYDQVWCVFDADPKPGNSIQARNFNAAISRAASYGFQVAYSNQAFEYWILLHFEDHQGGAMPRKDYHKKINGFLKSYKLSYDGVRSKIITAEIFELLDGIDENTGIERKRLAIKRAERNYNRFDHTNPASEESSTTVFMLVSELLKYFCPRPVFFDRYSLSHLDFDSCCFMPFTVSFMVSSTVSFLPRRFLAGRDLECKETYEK